MDGFQLIDGVSSAFYALVGLWAALDPRHWFVRFAVMGGLLLMALFIPAYEVVVMFGIQISLILAVVWLIRARRGWRPRLSLETALLTMVVVAVTAAVVARIPHISPGKWAFLVNTGVSSALGALVALWTVYTRAPLRIRVAGALLGFLGFLIVYHFGRAIEITVWQLGTGTPWQQSLAGAYQPAEIGKWLANRLPPALLSMTLLMGTLALARASGWFNFAQSPRPSSSRRLVLAARGALMLLALAFAAPMSYLFYALLTPTPIPIVKFPEPNGYDDFIAAGLATPPSARTIVTTRPKPSRATLKAAYHEYAPIAQQVDEGLRKPCLAPFYGLDQRHRRDRDSEAIDRAAFALIARLMYLNQYGPQDEFISAALQYIRFVREVERGSTADWSFYRQSETTPLYFLQDGLGRFDAKQCRDLAAALSHIEAQSEPFEAYRARRLIIDENSGWEKHFQVLVPQWSGEDPYKFETEYVHHLTTQMRLLIADAAAQSLALERGRPADSLAELAPEYLQAPPLDPFGAGPLHYRREGAEYVIYSLGPDHDDDGGRINSPTPQSQDYDIAVRGPHAPPLWMTLRDSTVEGFKALWKAGADAAGPTAE